MMVPNSNTPSKEQETPTSTSERPPSVNDALQSSSTSTVSPSRDQLVATLERSTIKPIPVSTSNPSEEMVPNRSYSAYLPHNPSRPPPHTYQRLHEFPPFPPLTQHPVLPFLTTAFSRVQQGDKSSAPLPKTKPLAPKASTTQRHVQSNISTIPTMDVSRNDPSAIFLRPPLVVPYPQSTEEGSEDTEDEPAPGTPLTYALMHTHRNWFLDADDFRKDNPNRIDYPPELEPPRGWAPLSECGSANRSKQVKEAERNNAIRTKGSYTPTNNHGAIEYGPLDECHEKTVLRCTFCRREYHGPNAKSMWRRHVFDKHKVAMKNRREGSAGTMPRSAARKGKSKHGAAQPTLPLAPPNLDMPTLSLDLTNEQNIIRFLERVVSGNVNFSLPSTLFSEGRSQNISLETIVEVLQKSGISVILDKDKPLEEYSVTPPTTDGETSHDSDITPSKSQPQQATESVSPRFFAAEASPPTERQRNSLMWQSDASLSKSNSNDMDSNVHVSSIWNRFPLKDNTAADRNHHNRPGTPEKGKGKQKALPLPKTPNGPSMSPISSLNRNPFTPRHFPTTAMRARALATTGQESYLSLIVSSPALSSPLRGPGITLTSPFKSRGSPSKSKPKDPALSNEDLNSLVSPYLGIGDSENAYIFDNIPLEVNPRTSWSPATSLGPPAPLSTKRPRSRSRTGARRVKDDLELQYPQKISQHEDQDMEHRYPVGSSPLEGVQRRRSVADTKMHDDDFNLNEFLDLDDIAGGMGSSTPSSPLKPSLVRGFSKEFGLLSQEEVDRLTGSTLSSIEEEARSSKRRKVEASQ